MYTALQAFKDKGIQLKGEADLAATVRGLSSSTAALDAALQQHAEQNPSASQWTAAEGAKLAAALHEVHVTHGGLTQWDKALHTLAEKKASLLSPCFNGCQVSLLVLTTTRSAVVYWLAQGVHKYGILACVMWWQTASVQARQYIQ